MGRGLGELQRRILAVGVAHNAARNGGAPSPVDVAATEVEGTRKRREFFGAPLEWATRSTVCTAPAVPEVCEPFLFVVLGGFRRRTVRRSVLVGSTMRRNLRLERRRVRLAAAGIVCTREPEAWPVSPYHRATAAKWEPSTVCHKRRVSISRALEGLEARGFVVWAESPRYFGDEVEQLVEGRWSQDTARFWSTTHERTGAAFLTADAYEVVGDAWREFDPVSTLADWEHATGRSRS